MLDAECAMVNTERRIGLLASHFLRFGAPQATIAAD